MSVGSDRAERMSWDHTLLGVVVKVSGLDRKNRLCARSAEGSKILVVDCCKKEKSSAWGEGVEKMAVDIVQQN